MYIVLSKSWSLISKTKHRKQKTQSTNHSEVLNNVQPIKHDVVSFVLRVCFVPLAALPPLCQERPSRVPSGLDLAGRDCHHFMKIQGEQWATTYQ